MKIKRLKPVIVSQLLRDTASLILVAEFCGVSVWTVKYRWLADNDAQYYPPALLHAVSKYLNIEEALIEECYTPIKPTSTIN